MKKYEVPELIEDTIELEDIIATSVGFGDSENETEDMWGK